MAETRQELEEERRLFYVAVTRAEEALTISYAKSRYRYGQIQYNEPSRFVDEIDKQYLKIPSRRPVARHPLEPNARRKKPANLRPIAQTSRRPARSSSPIPDDFVASDPSKITTGMTVRHPKFGVGKVISMEMVGSQQKATVFFQGSGKKNLLLKYAKLMILG
jgi:DNA helicase-2/ATP-dependent DNA helicase PcrA